MSSNFKPVPVAHPEPARAAGLYRLAIVGAGTLKGGRHIKYPDHTPMTNLLLTVLTKAGVKMDKLGDSNGLMGDL